MIRFFLRVLGFVLSAAAFAALVVDGSRSIAGGRLMVYSLRETAAWIGGERAAAALTAVTGWPGPARDAAIALLAVPAWLVAALLGLLLLRAGRQPPAGIGFSRSRT